MKFILVVVLTAYAFYNYAQQAVLNTVKIKSSGEITEIKIEVRTTYDTFYLNIDGYGQVLSIEPINAGNNFTIDYYDRFAEPEIIGKISMLNQTKISYFLRGGTPNEIVGKMMKIGNVKIDYYYSDPDKTGRIYFVGNLVMNYYTRSNDAVTATKISKVGNINIEYFTSFSDIELQGFVKKIGDYEIEYFKQYDDTAKSRKIKKINGSDNRFKLIVEL